jgi:NADH:ubiquinone oxidoreductase subunit 4 (subunit M)
MGFPGTSSFVGEFLVSVGLVRENLFLFLISGVGLVFSAVYSIWLYNRVMFGSLRQGVLLGFSDLTRSEFCILSFLFLIVLIFGLGSIYYFEYFEDFCYNLFYLER